MALRKRSFRKQDGRIDVEGLLGSKPAYSSSSGLSSPTLPPLSLASTAPAAGVNSVDDAKHNLIEACIKKVTGVSEILNESKFLSILSVLPRYHIWVTCSHGFDSHTHTHTHTLSLSLSLTPSPFHHMAGGLCSRSGGNGLSSIK